MLSPDRPSKAIPPARDLLQSRLLVAVLVPVLAGCTLHGITLGLSQTALYFGLDLAISVAFALLAWSLKAATPGAAACGGIICFLLTSTGAPGQNLVRSGLTPLVALFLLTFAATRFGRRHKELRGLAEARTGRSASQVIANLGAAAVCAAISRPHPMVFVAVLGALGEATADTLSSEIGQAVGGTPFLLTTFQRVPPGTDGAITFGGTASGLLGAAVVIWLGLPQHSSRLLYFGTALIAATAGLFFDSLLGATIERRGYLGNDLVNFSSTLFSAAVTWPLLLAIRSVHL